MHLLSDEPAVQQARAHSGRIVRALNDLAALVQEAWDKRYDRVLRYKSWQAYCLGEFGSGETAIRARQIITVMLRGEDLTEQAIAEQLGVSQPTVNRDLSEQDGYAPVHGGRTGDQRRQRRREQYRQPSMPEAAPALADRRGLDVSPATDAFLSWAQSHPEWLRQRPRRTYSAEPVHDELTDPIDLAPPAGIQYESAAREPQSANARESAASHDEPAIGGQPAIHSQPPEDSRDLLEVQPPAAIVTAATPVQPASPRERFLQGDTGGARAEIRHRVLAGQPVRRDQIAARYGVSEMFARQATAVEEEAAGIPDTVAHCVRELTALRDKYARVLSANPWADQCLQLVIDSLRTDLQPHCISQPPYVRKILRKTLAKTHNPV